MTKKALCIGINDYPGTNSDLYGCVNDAEDWTAVLTKRGFAVETLRNAQATKSAMVAAIRTLLQQAKSGDNVVLTYSGHGTLAPDLNGDEPDGYDEALCPHDIASAGPLIDDEIHALFAERARGVRLLLISDSCHSGTVTRGGAFDPLAEGSRVRFMPMAAWLPESKLPRAAGGEIATRVAVSNTSSPWGGALVRGTGSDLLIAGCEEGPNDYSYDATIAGRANGAFTHYALKTLAQLPKDATYAQWYAELRKWLPSINYPQTPKLFGGKLARKYKIFE